MTNTIETTNNAIDKKETIANDIYNIIVANVTEQKTLDHVVKPLFKPSNDSYVVEYDIKAFSNKVRERLQIHVKNKTFQIYVGNDIDNTIINMLRDSDCFANHTMILSWDKSNVKERGYKFTDIETVEKIARCINAVLRDETVENIDILTGYKKDVKTDEKRTTTTKKTAKKTTATKTAKKTEKTTANKA